MNEDTYLSVLAHMLDSSPYPSGLKSKEGVFLYANKAYCKLVNVPNNIAGLTDREIPCDTAAFSDVFLQQDQYALSHNKTVVTFDVHNYAHGIDAYSFVKQPIIINDQPWGIQFTASKIKDWLSMSSLTEVLAVDKSNLYFSTAIPTSPQLTPSQEVVLFWLLRGRQVKQIAELIYRTPKAVEKQVANLIGKFSIHGVTNRASLIEYARCNGWLSLMSEQVLRTPVSMMINNDEGTLSPSIY
ncbi:LuxR family transcriptional regulator [Photobacterium leiognathi subsp. mandapamensis]|uniref:LuxR family transcriptional regulator n=1 Tax=Photobacterium leiognathi TaxID=553611 RepID=UPI003AF3E53B